MCLNISNGRERDADHLLYHPQFYPPHRQRGGPERVPPQAALTQEGSLAPQPREEVCFSDGYEEEDREVPRLREVRPHRARKARRSLLLLDACASLCVVVMTITITLQVLMG